MNWPFESISTCHPQSPGTASVPPTILLDGFKDLCPQLGGFRFSVSVIFKNKLAVDVVWVVVVVVVVEPVEELVDLLGAGPVK